MSAKYVAYSSCLTKFGRIKHIEPGIRHKCCSAEIQMDAILKTCNFAVHKTTMQVCFLCGYLQSLVQP